MVFSLPVFIVLAITAPAGIDLVLVPKVVGASYAVATLVISHNGSVIWLADGEYHFYSEDYNVSSANATICVYAYNAGGVCSYAMLFYNGCTVVVNQYPGSEITADVSNMRLAYNSTSSVTLVQQQ